MANEFEDRFAEKDINNALNAWRESADRQAERPDWFWARQSARIHSRINPPVPKRMPRAAWAGIAATIAVGVALMVPGDKSAVPDQPQTVTTAQSESQISDHELLQQLQETMNSEVPDALQPASTLAQEMEQAYSAKTTSKSKESTK